MELKDVRLKKGMSRDEVNELIKEFDIELLDGIYEGNSYPHNWIGDCDHNVEGRMWATIRRSNTLNCLKCKRIEIESKYKYEVEQTNEYEYLKGYFANDILPNGNIVKDRKTYITIKHKFCESIYTIESRNFIKKGQRCDKCCGSYENSFAFHIEKELNEPLDKYWDYERNTVNPNTISKYKNAKNSKGEDTRVWIKCTEKEYHGSYKSNCNDFVRGSRCPYCSSKKIHQKDSFAQYHIDNTDPQFLEKYWDWNKNNINPWDISINAHKKVWIKCQEISYHNSYLVSCGHFTNKKKCSYCASRKIHPLDSFGYHHFDKVMSWHLDNKISPFRVALKSGKKYKFTCESCNESFLKPLSDISYRGDWCPNCSASKGEKRIIEILRKNNIEFEYNKEYFDDLKGLKMGVLRPDFILPKHRIWIEYDGEFHFEDRYKDGSIEVQKEHDKRKDEYAKEHGWKMIRIPYWEFDNIEEILNRELNIGKN